jgi:ABC-type sugar transport system substrate-binding protein
MCAQLRYQFRRIVAVLAGIVALAPPGAAQPAGRKPRIAFFSPSSEANTYWPQVYRVIDAVGEDLGFDLLRYDFGVGNRFARQRAAIKALQSDPKPDAAIVSVVIGTSKAVIEAAEARGIPVVILGPVFPSELPELGAPRRKYKQWIATAYQDETEKGDLLAEALLTAAEKAKAFAKDGTLQVVGVGGDTTWFGSGMRQAGLERALARHPKAVLRQIVPTFWTQAEGRDLTAKMLKRFPEASVVWAASDQLAIGAAEALAASGRALGRSGFTGGLDLSDNGLARVKEGKLVATVASSMLSFAEIAVLLYDYLHGVDFAPETGVELKAALYVAREDDVDRFLRLSRDVARIDFRRLSKAYTRTLKRYDFSLERLEAAEASAAPAP